MAISSDQLQTALGLNPNNAQVRQHCMPLISTIQVWYVEGNQDAPGRARWVTTTASDNAATQATAVLTALRAT